MHEVGLYAKSAVVPVIIAGLTIAVYFDCRWRLIPNLLTFPLLGLGLALNWTIGGWSGLVFAILGAVVGCGLMMIPYVFGQMGGGDVKLLLALGSFLGAYAILNVFLYTTLAGGVLAVAYAVRHNEGKNTMRKVGQLALSPIARKESSGEVETVPTKSITIPYGIAIAAGTLVYLVIGKIV